MSEISLRVTKAVLEHTKTAGEGQRQIAYSSPSSDVAAVLAAVSAKNRVILRLGDRISLVVADRGAIWRAHNDQYAADFNALFTLLAGHPSQEMRFLCEVVR